MNAYRSKLPKKWTLRNRFIRLSPFFGLFAVGCIEAAEADFFDSKVLPVLQRRCYECHSHEKKIKGGLTLDSRSGWEKGGDTGPALVPGKPDDSLLIKAIRYSDPDLSMPPKKRLSAEEVAVLTEWVKLGAPDPREGADSLKKITAMSIEEARAHWAFQAIRDRKSVV